MATIPSGQKFHTIASDVDTMNRGSASANADRSIFTMQDIEDTVSGSVGDIGGSIADNQIAIGSSIADEIEGSSALTFDGSTMSITGDISAVDVTATGVTATPTLSVTGGAIGSLNVVFGTAPTAASFGTIGDIIIDADAIYVCTVTGVDPTAATWLKANLGAL